MKTSEKNLMSKKIIPSCLVFCLLLQIGCSLFDKSESESKSEQKTAAQQESSDAPADEAKTNQANDKLQNAQTNLSDLKDEANPERVKAAAAAKKCNDNITLSKKNNKNYNDPKTETFKQCQEAKDLQTAYDEKVDAAKEEVAKANKELQNSQSQNPKDSQDAGKSESSSFTSWLIPLIAGLAGLSLLGVIGYLIYRFSQRAKLEREATHGEFGLINSKHNNLRQEIEQLKVTAELLSKQLSEQRKEIGALKARTQSQENYAEQPPPPLPSNYSYHAPAPKFPVTVENYLAKNAVGAVFGKYDPLFGTLKENDADGAFYLIRDGAISDDARYAVPRTKQFVTRDDFAYHYSNYYECADPTGGEVWIKKPATVRRTPDGWRLDARGELEVH